MNVGHRTSQTLGSAGAGSETANSYLALGESAEAEEQWGLALEYYGIGLSLLSKDTRTVYLLFMNAARCLNELELYSEGESYCRRAVEIDPSRSEGYKNLAISRRGQADLRGAAWYLVRAIKIDPSDERATQLLEQLLRDHPRLSFQCPWIGRGLELRGR
jgi:tetratricopeptide (TPR) repeat protein